MFSQTLQHPNYIEHPGLLATRAHETRRLLLPRSTSTGPRILSVGDDPMLLGSRHMLLESAGYQVLSVSSSRVIRQEHQGAFDLAVVCHTTVISRAQLVASLQSSHPQVPILLLERAAGGCSDGMGLVLSRPEELLRTVRDIIEIVRDQAKMNCDNQG